MLSPLASAISRGGKGISGVVRKAPGSVRCYSVQKQIDEFKTESEQLLKEIKTNIQPGVDFKTAIPKESQEIISHYKELYTSVAGPGATTLSSNPASFHKKPERVQQILKDYKTNIHQTYVKFLEKNPIEDVQPGVARMTSCLEAEEFPVTEPVRVCITGAAGAIGYSLAYRIASGGLFGPKTPIILQLLELPQAQNALKGVEMELLDCAFPTLQKVIITDSPEKAFENVDYAFLVGAQPRTKGMERGDLLMKNAEIFATQGKALNVAAKGADTRVLVVGNPANTNALIASHHARSIPKSNFIAMTRLDHNRALAQVAEKAKVPLSAISRVIIWGNHSATQFPDLSHAFIGEELALNVVKDDWYKKDFIPAVQQRGAKIIDARGASSAASAASSAMDTVFDWHFGTNAQWISAAVHSNGEYGVTPGLYYSYPVVFNDRREWDIVRNLPIDLFSAEKMELTHKELLSERDAVSKLLA